MGCQVLIIDDDEDIREALREALEMSDYSVVTAENGRRALEMLRAGCSPSVILLDLLMPVMDGWQFQTEAQRDPALSHIPVVIISATGSRAEIRRLNAAEYLSKPVSLDKLLEVVGRHCATPTPQP